MLSTKTVEVFAKGATHVKPRKLMLAGVLAACAFSGIAMGIAWATPGSLVTPVRLTGPVLLEDVDLKSESDVNEVEIQMKGFTDAYVVHYTFGPGGHSGWHSHPGPCFVSVKSGTATEYHAHNPDHPHVYPAGTGFVENAGFAHLVVNEEDTDLELVVLHLVPVGAPIRINEPAP